MSNIQLQFDAIKWPNEFIVEFMDGEEKIFTSKKGVQLDNGQDLEGDDENRINIYCALKKKSPSQQHYRKIEFFIDEVKQFKTLTGELIWEPST